MKAPVQCLIAIWGSLALAPSPAATASQAGTPSALPVRPIGVITELRPGSLTLHTDVGTDLVVELPEGLMVLRVPPGAKDLKAAAKIALSDVNKGDRVLIRGKLSEGQRSLRAAAIIVMTQTDLAKAREAERLEWQRRGIGGLVKGVNPATKEITISVPSTSPTPGNPTHPVTISLGPNAALLRYAPDSVKFSDAKPSAFDEIKVGDQVRALGTKSEDGSHFTAEKLVSGAFRDIGATVISVQMLEGSVVVKDLATGKPLLVRTNADSMLHRLPPDLAQMIAAFNSGNPRSSATQGQSGNGGSESASGAGAASAGAVGSGHSRSENGVPRDFNQMLERTPALNLGELKPGEALIVVTTQGANLSEVTAIIMLAGVEPILTARPKGSSDVVLGPWSISMGGGEAGP